MLKHMVDQHEGDDFDKVEFRMKAVKFHKTAFERQVYESVKIQNIREHHDILNSKAEFNRCAIPRLGLKMGDSETRERKKMKRQEEKNPSR
jgi:hypothetical protein